MLDVRLDAVLIPRAKERADQDLVASQEVRKALNRLGTNRAPRLQAEQGDSLVGSLGPDQAQRLRLLQLGAQEVGQPGPHPVEVGVAGPVLERQHDERRLHRGRRGGGATPADRDIFLEFEAPVAQAQPAAQAPRPDTEIFLAPLTARDGRIEVGAPVNITGNPGYDNQPFFTAYERQRIGVYLVSNWRSGRDRRWIGDAIRTPMDELFVRYFLRNEPEAQEELTQWLVRPKK